MIESTLTLHTADRAEFLVTGCNSSKTAMETCSMNHGEVFAAFPPDAPVCAEWVLGNSFLVVVKWPFVFEYLGDAKPNPFCDFVKSVVQEMCEALGDPNINYKAHPVAYALYGPVNPSWRVPFESKRTPIQLEDW